VFVHEQQFVLAFCRCFFRCCSPMTRMWVCSHLLGLLQATVSNWFVSTALADVSCCLCMHAHSLVVTTRIACRLPKLFASLILSDHTASLSRPD
jgi:hypothetical protein